MNGSGQIPNSGNFATLDRIRGRRSELQRDFNDKDALNEIQIQGKWTNAQDIARGQRFVVFDLSAVEKNGIARAEIANVVVVVGEGDTGMKTRDRWMIEQQLAGGQSPE